MPPTLPTCRICTHPEHETINQYIWFKVHATEKIAAAYGFTVDDILRHTCHLTRISCPFCHLPPKRVREFAELVGPGPNGHQSPSLVGKAVGGNYDTAWTYMHARGHMSDREWRKWEEDYALGYGELRPEILVPMSATTIAKRAESLARLGGKALPPKPTDWTLDACRLKTGLARHARRVQAGSPAGDTMDIACVKLTLPYIPGVSPGPSLTKKNSSLEKYLSKLPPLPGTVEVPAPAKPKSKSTTSSRRKSVLPPPLVLNPPPAPARTVTPEYLREVARFLDLFAKLGDQYEAAPDEYLLLNLPTTGEHIRVGDTRLARSLYTETLKAEYPGR